MSIKQIVGIAAAFVVLLLVVLALRPAHAMEHDLSNTWCANHIPDSAMSGREVYYAWIDKCHRRRGTKACYGNPGISKDVERCKELEPKPKKIRTWRIR